MKLYKSFVAVLLVLSVSMALPACSEEKSDNADVSKNPVSEEALAERGKEAMKESAKIELEKAQLREALGERSVYPDFTRASGKENLLEPQRGKLLNPRKRTS